MKPFSKIQLTLKPKKKLCIQKVNIFSRELNFPSRCQFLRAEKVLRYQKKNFQINFDIFATFSSSSQSLMEMKKGWQEMRTAFGNLRDKNENNKHPPKLERENIFNHVKEVDFHQNSKVASLFDVAHSMKKPSRNPIHLWIGLEAKQTLMNPMRCGGDEINSTLQSRNFNFHLCRYDPLVVYFSSFSDLEPFSRPKMFCIGLEGGWDLSLLLSRMFIFLFINFQGFKEEDRNSFVKFLFTTNFPLVCCRFLQLSKANKTLEEENWAEIFIEWKMPSKTHIS